MKARTFREAYGVLQAHADTLREQTEPNIDDLLAIVTESVAAYQVCKERIDAVEKALKAALTDVGTDLGRTAEPLADEEAALPKPRRASAKATPPPPVAAVEDLDDDVPF